MILYKKETFKQIKILISMLSCMCNFCNYIDYFDADIAWFLYSCVIIFIGVTCKPISWLQSIDECNRAANQLVILTRKSRHFDDISVIGCIRSCCQMTTGENIEMATVPFQCIVWSETPVNWRLIWWRVAKSLLTKVDIHETHMSARILSLFMHHHHHRRKRSQIYNGL